MIGEFFDLPTMDNYRFVVLDAMAAEFLPEELITEILVPKGLLQSAHLMPRLVDPQLLSKDEAIAFYAGLRDAYKSLQPSSLAVFIATEGSRHEFVRHWNAMQIASARGKQKCWLRIHDPRVLHQLLRILNPMQRRALFGPAKAFHYWIGDKWNIALRDPQECPATHVASVRPAGWDWPRIEQIGIVNRALHGAGIYESSLLTVQGALAEQLIQRAVVRYGLRGQADIIEFTTRGLLFGPLFDEHPRIANAIKATNESAEITSLSDRFALVENEVWTSFPQLSNSH